MCRLWIIAIASLLVSDGTAVAQPALESRPLLERSARNEAPVRFERLDASRTGVDMAIAIDRTQPVISFRRI